MGDDAQPPRRLEVRDLHVLRFGPPEQGPRLEACALFERPRRQKLDGLSRTDGQRLSHNIGDDREDRLGPWCDQALDLEADLASHPPGACDGSRATPNG